MAVQELEGKRSKTVVFWCADVGKRRETVYDDRKALLQLLEKLNPLYIVIIIGICLHEIEGDKKWLEKMLEKNLYGNKIQGTADFATK